MSTSGLSDLPDSPQLSDGMPSSHTSESDREHELKNEKLKGFENWPRWSDITRLTLEAKGVWNLVDGSKPPLPPNATAKTFEDQAKSTAKALRIIKKGVHPDLHPNIIDKRDPKAAWETLERVKKEKRKQAYVSLDYLFFTQDGEIIFAQ